MTSRPPSRARATLLGLLAIVLWSTTFGASRIAQRELGTFTATACMYTLAGILGLTHMALQTGRPAAWARLRKDYLFGCGALCVLYLVGLSVAIGFAADERQVVEASVVNYLWPSLTLLLSVPLLGHRARPWLAPGMALATAGIVLAVTPKADLSWSGFAGNVVSNPLPYGAALFCAVAWALYSNLSRRWVCEGGAAPLFLLAAGVALGVVRLGASEAPVWSPKAVAAVGYMAVFPAWLAYAFWDAAMRRGNVPLIAAASFFTPLLSVLASALLLGVGIGWRLVAASALVIAGAALSKWSVMERADGSDHAGA